jgi:hypothetical protein
VRVASARICRRCQALINDVFGHFMQSRSVVSRVGAKKCERCVDGHSVSLREDAIGLLDQDTTFQSVAKLAGNRDLSLDSSFLEKGDGGELCECSG